MRVAILVVLVGEGEADALLVEEPVGDLQGGIGAVGECQREGC